MDERQQQLLAWASENVRKPWEAMVAAAAKVASGEPMTPQQARVAVPLTPFTADARTLYPLMRSFTGLLTWSPNNLFTIITDDECKTILRAYIEVTRDHNFVKMITVDPSEPFLKQVLPLIQSGNLYPLRRLLDDACREKYNVRVNWVKIAGIEFFGAFADHLRKWELSGDLWDWVQGAFNAVRQIYQRDLIAFSPEPPAFARLRDLFSGILEVDLSHLDLQGIFGPIKADQPAKKEIIVLIVDNHDIAGLSLGGDQPLQITLNQNVSDHLQGVPFHKLAKTCAELLEVDQVIVLRAEPVANLLYEAMFHPMPYQREDTKIVLRKSLEIIRRFRELWTMHPLPFYLRDGYRLPAKWMGNPFDINYLASWFLPGMIVDGEAVFLGQHSIRTFVTLDGEKILAMYTLEFFDTGLRKIQTHAPKDYAEVFSDLQPTINDVRERAVQLGIRLWKEGHGFQNMVTVTQAKFMRTLGEAGAISTWKSPLTVYKAIKPIRSLIKQAKQGAVVVYPDAMLVELERWVKKVGRLKIYSALITVPFDRKKPRSRGLQYIGASLLGAGVVAGVVALIALL